MRTRWGVTAAVVASLCLFVVDAGRAAAATVTATTSTNQLVSTSNGALSSPFASLVQSGTGVGLESTASSGQTVFAGAPEATFTREDQGAIFAYNELATGLAGTPAPSAVLSASNPANGADVGEILADDGPTLVSGSYSATGGTGQILVFREPAGGWSGTISQSATLEAPGGVRLFSPVVHGNTVVALGQFPSSPNTGDSNPLPVVDLFEFTKPAGGWSGTLNPTADLIVPPTDPIADSGSSVAFDGDDVVAGSTAGNDVFVFTPPTAGWSGVVSPIATLNGPKVPGFIGTQVGRSVTAAGSTIITSDAYGFQSGADVYIKPTEGWQSTSSPTALLRPPSGIAAFSAEDAYGQGNVVMSADGSTVAIPEMVGGGFGIEVFTQPSGGWSGTVSASAFLSGDQVLASDQFAGSSIVAATQGAAAGEPTSSLLDAPEWEPSSSIADGTLVTGAGAELFTPPPGGFVGAPQPTATYAAPATGSVAVDQISPAGGVTAMQATGTLTIPGPVQSSDPLPLIDGTQMVAALPTATRSDLGVYEQSATDWTLSRPAATLSDPYPTPLSALAFSGDTVIAGTATPDPPVIADQAKLALYSEPYGGWAGVVTPIGTYTAPVGDAIEAAAVSDGVLVIELRRFEDLGGTTLKVFTEGSDGWARVLKPASTLTTPSSPANLLGFDGTSITAGLIGSGPVLAGVSDETGGLIFARPRTGWHGAVRPTATLLAPATPHHDGFASWIYQRPARGSTGSVAPAALLAAADSYASGDIQGYASGTVHVSPDGRTLLISEAVDVGDGHYGPEPGTGKVEVLREPTNGWHGVLDGTPALESVTELPPAAVLDGSDVIVADGLGDGSGVLDVDAVEHPTTATESASGKPRLLKGSLSGTSTQKPLLHLTIAAADYGLTFATIRVRAPAGLVFAHLQRNLSSGISACRTSGTRCTVTGSGELELNLPLNAHAVSQLHLVVRPAALAESAALRRTLKRHPRTLDFGVAVTSSDGHTVNLTARLR